MLFVKASICHFMISWWGEVSCQSLPLMGTAHPIRKLQSCHEQFWIFQEENVKYSYTCNHVICLLWFVMVLGACLAWELLVLPSDAQAAPNLPFMRVPDGDTRNQPTSHCFPNRHIWSLRCQQEPFLELDAISAKKEGGQTSSMTARGASELLMAFPGAAPVA